MTAVSGIYALGPCTKLTPYSWVLGHRVTLSPAARRRGRETRRRKPPGAGYRQKFRPRASNSTKPGKNSVRARQPLTEAGERLAARAWPSGRSALVGSGRLGLLDHVGPCCLHQVGGAGGRDQVERRTDDRKQAKMVMVRPRCLAADTGRRARMPGSQARKQQRPNRLLICPRPGLSIKGAGSSRADIPGEAGNERDRVAQRHAGVSESDPTRPDRPL